MCALQCPCVEVYDVLMYTLYVAISHVGIVTVQKYLALATILITRRIMTWPTENCIIGRRPSAFGN